MNWILWSTRLQGLGMEKKPWWKTCPLKIHQFGFNGVKHFWKMGPLAPRKKVADSVNGRKEAPGISPNHQGCFFICFAFKPLNYSWITGSKEENPYDFSPPKVGKKSFFEGHKKKKQRFSHRPIDFSKPLGPTSNHQQDSVWFNEVSTFRWGLSHGVLWPPAPSIHPWLHGWSHVGHICLSNSRLG